MKRYFCILLTILSLLLNFSMQCRADHGHHSHHHGSDWSDWATALGFTILGLGLWTEINRPKYPPPQLYMQPMPQELIKPGYMYYCVYANGYYPYTPGCPGGWLKVIPIPQPPPQQ